MQSRVKDEFEYATNWMRVFINLYRNLKWLNAYAEINQQALKTLTKDFSQTFFKNKQGQTLSEDLLAFIDLKNFAIKDSLLDVIKSFL